MQRPAGTMDPGSLSGPARAWRDAVMRWTMSLERYKAAAVAGSPLDPAFKHKLLWEKLRVDSLRRQYRAELEGSAGAGGLDAPLWWRHRLLEQWTRPDPARGFQLDSHDPWYKFAEELEQLPQLSAAPAGVGAGAGVGRGRGGWETAARGWGAAALLLALLLLLVRVSERCLHRPIFKLRRSRSAPNLTEWPTPNVQATCRVHGIPDEELGSIDPYSEHLNLDSVSNDAPPPYSNVAHNKPIIDEPPPPYSNCFVAFTNPKEGHEDDFENATPNGESQRILDTGQCGDGNSSNVEDNSQRDDESSVNGSVNVSVNDDDVPLNSDANVSDANSGDVEIRRGAPSKATARVEDVTVDI